MLNQSFDYSFNRIPRTNFRLLQDKNFLSDLQNALKGVKFIIIGLTTNIAEMALRL